MVTMRPKLAAAADEATRSGDVDGGRGGEEEEGGGEGGGEEEAVLDDENSVDDDHDGGSDGSGDGRGRVLLGRFIVWGSGLGAPRRIGCWRGQAGRTSSRSRTSRGRQEAAPPPIILVTETDEVALLILVDN